MPETETSTPQDGPSPTVAPAHGPGGGYQVLARKYRPQTFADLIGQDAMVRTLRNAFAADRIAHAFILTGIRGTGKTTTARIVAKGLNCVGPDGTGGPTTEPCGVCANCVAIAEGRHVDVLEMDAASRTGVGDIREIIDSVRYRAASARYKIYIIDEVHMLSTSAFNALLKTLEEPPEHVKFIFATTEIRKVPVTVLSRCQRFDLRRVEPDAMMAHLARIAGAEGAAVAPDALALLTRAAEGSVRDAVSLLDQAIAHGHGETTADEVRAMLGLADRGRVLDLFDLVMRGDAAGALAELAAQYANGADPMAVLRDLAEVTHWISVIRITPEAANDPTVAPEERSRGRDMATRLPMRSLTRAWQMLLTALEEVAQAPNAMMAAEMTLIRLTHVADLPSPEELVRKLQAEPPPPRDDPVQGAAPPANGTASMASPMPAGGSALAGEASASTARDTSPTAGARPAASAASAGGSVPTPGASAASSRGAHAGSGGALAARVVETDGPLARFSRFESVVELIRANRDVRLLVEVETTLRLAAYAPGRIEFEPGPNAPADLAQRLGARLQAWTGTRWAVSVVAAGGQPTIAETRSARLAARRAEARVNPLVQSILSVFPDAEITEVRAPAELAPGDTEIAAPDADEDWDPLEE